MKYKTRQKNFPLSKETSHFSGKIFLHDTFILPKKLGTGFFAKERAKTCARKNILTY
jgi:hypothetical protein